MFVRSLKYRHTKFTKDRIDQSYHRSRYRSISRYFQALRGKSLKSRKSYLCCPWEVGEGVGWNGVRGEHGRKRKKKEEEGRKNR